MRIMFFQSAEWVGHNCPIGCNADEDYDFWKVHILSDEKPMTIVCSLHRGYTF
jgi:hypothetical protein